MASKLKQRLRARMKELGWSQQDLADESGVKFETIKALFGRTSNPRATTIHAVARAVQRDPRFLTGEIDAVEQAPAEPKGEFLPIRYRVAAGVWRERDDEVQEFLGEGPMPPPDAFAAFPQWWEVVEGESINRIYPPGALVRVIDAIALGYRPRNDDLVILERRRDGRAERTVKQVRISGRRVIVQGSSTNKRYNAELDVTEGLVDGDEVEIVGFVAGAYIPTRR